MARKIKYPGDSLKYAKLQQNERAAFERLDDVHSALKLLDMDLPPVDVLDVGAGIGRGVLAMHQRWSGATYWLYDGEGDRQVCGVNETLGPGSFYSNVVSTAFFLRANGVRNFFQVRDDPGSIKIDVTERQAEVVESQMVVGWDYLPQADVKFDLVTSFRAVGFHWPMHPMLEMLAEHTAPGGTLLYESRPLLSGAYPRNDDGRSRFQSACRLVFSDLKAIAECGQVGWELVRFEHVLVGKRWRAYVVARRKL